MQLKRFRATFDATLDGRRLYLPKSFQEVLKGETTVVLVPWDNCLKVYPAGEWRKIQGNLEADVAFKHPGLQNFFKVMAGNVFECIIRTCYRITLPLSMIEEFKLEKKIIMEGHLFYFEIWNKKLWEKMKMSQQEDIKRMSQWEDFKKMFHL